MVEEGGATQIVWLFVKKKDSAKLGSEIGSVVHDGANEDTPRVQA